jgi:5'-nucleotidase
MRRPPLLVLLLIIATGLAPVSTQTPAPYRILVTNDDGIRAPGIVAVAQALGAVGEVTVVAPADNQSGKSHSLTLADPIYVEKVTFPGAATAYALTATPASCVKVALAALLSARPDLVVSGINRGQNVGRVTYISGTVGAAREAAMQGIPAIAASLFLAGGSEGSYEPGAQAVRRIAETVKTIGLDAGVFLNVNVPPGPQEAIRGIRLATQSALIGTERFVEHSRPPTGRRYFWNVYVEPTGGAPGDDLWTVEQGYVAVVPLRASEYDARAADKLKGTLSMSKADGRMLK